MTTHDFLPIEIFLLIAESSDLHTLCSFVRAFPHVAEALTSPHFSIHDEFQNSIVHLLAADGEHELFLQVLKCRSALPDRKNKDGHTPMSLAVTNGHLPVVQALVNRNDVDTSLTDSMNRTLLHMASLSGHESVLDVVMHWPAVYINQKDKHGQTAFSLAAEYGQERAVVMMIKEADLYARDVWGRVALHVAALNGHQKIVKILLSKPDVDANILDDRRWTPLSYAAGNGHAPVIEALLRENDVDIYWRGIEHQDPLSLAAENGNPVAVDLLLRRMQQDLTASKGPTHQLSSQLNFRDLWGRTPVSIAAEYGHEAVVTLLVALPDVDINVGDYGQEGPLTKAARNGHESIVQLLLDRPDIDICSSNVRRQTPLDLAVLAGHTNIVMVLQRHSLIAAPDLAGVSLSPRCDIHN
ncbi:hypothetical protein ANOM_002670 [Aspergillus nomiae NRRL 13137]|uniref:Uncharacterized protein n=1 Tax=Aspergillus nomiae NRRL (strain ATCC 15546 / NRRL 13137 / CBS 260.88 / M93) TaxID=1509407 RepID=A0A0L1JC43_ASPN3|nr:uncharacterized protein ANOM_002670 [Aspergillus nomiae NRRL 13137]KNG89341.1 hypothetical protein ANOM_002670 [Aspergillus nomiae NRRL 13137]